MKKKHQYKLNLKWLGNRGHGTSNYTAYNREFEIHIDGKSAILGSSDSAFMGNPNFHNPEELFLASIASCHMLWYLHLCAENKINVFDYQDNPSGEMVEEANGSGYFKAVTLNPIVKIMEGDDKLIATQLHERANEFCFIANSCNFKISHKPEIHT